MRREQTLPLERLDPGAGHFIFWRLMLCVNGNLALTRQFMEEAIKLVG